MKLRLKTKKCPYCGNKPTLQIKPLWAVNGHSSYWMDCGCDHMCGGYATDMWQSVSDAKAQVVREWNEEVDANKDFLKRLKDTYKK